MPAGPHVGATIRRARKHLRMTQQELASKIGASRNAVDSWENERSYPKRFDVALEEVLGISLDGEPKLDELVPRNEWEQATLANPDLPYDAKRDFILEWRAARSAYKAQVAQEQGTAQTEDRRQAAG